MCRLAGGECLTPRPGSPETACRTGGRGRTPPPSESATSRRTYRRQTSRNSSNPSETLQEFSLRKTRLLVNVKDSLLSTTTGKRMRLRLLQLSMAMGEQFHCYEAGQPH